MTVGEGVTQCLSALRCDNTLRRVTAFISPRETVKATRIHKRDRRTGREEFRVTIGRPNYRERAWIKDLRAAYEPFPVRQVRLTFWPKRKSKNRDELPTR